MSGTSLDGLDLALCRFMLNDTKWDFEVLKAATVNYSGSMGNSLLYAERLNAEELIELDHRYGKWTAEQCNTFLENINTPPLLIASHGHTIFHQPEKGFSLQIGNGNDISAATGLPVVYDFRSMDIALGGQGAPLVPFGDDHLFSEYKYCLNLGGFSNISYRYLDKRIAFDICPVNTILNHIAGRMGYPFDKDGELGKQGIINHRLLKKLNNIEYYKNTHPRSLSKEWLDREFFNQLETSENNENILRTLYEHISSQITKVLNKLEKGEVLISGGGVKNQFLLSLIRKKCMQSVIIPDEIIIDYKEAIIFAFLGLMKYRNEINCYCSATGAIKDSSTGIFAVNNKTE